MHTKRGIHCQLHLTAGVVDQDVQPVKQLHRIRGHTDHGFAVQHVAHIVAHNVQANAVGARGVKCALGFLGSSIQDVLADERRFLESSPNWRETVQQ